MAPTLVASALAAAAAAMLACAGPAYQLGLLSLTSALDLFRWAAYTGVIAALANAVALANAARRRRRAAALIALAGAALSLATVIVPWRWQRAARRAPAIHDISTDLDDPPAFTAIAPLRQPTQNTLDRGESVAAEQRRGYPEIRPVSLPIPPDEAFEEALELIQEHEWEVVSADKERGVLEAIATTSWFGFKDDVVIRLRASGKGTRVDMRSASRIGISDVGTNAARVREFLGELERGE